MRMSWIFFTAFFLVMTGISSLYTGYAAASGSQAATFDRVELEVDPSIQGFGGEMMVTATAYFYGGCCYSLFASDIAPTLVLPEGLTIKTGPTPESKSSLTAVAGGEPTVIAFKWVLSCDEEGSHELSVKIDTSDCGSRDASYLVHIIKGATITRPERYPVDPTSDKSISLRFTSSYPVGDTKVTSARIKYWTSEKDYDVLELSVDDEHLLYQNMSAQPSKWGSVDADRDELDENGFKAVLPKVSEPFLYYIIEVKDDHGDVTRSSVYRLEVEDVGEVERWNLYSVLFLVIAMIVLLGVLFVGQNILNRRMDGVESNDRFSVLGPVGRKRFLTDAEEGSVKIIPERNWKYIVVGVVVVICTAITMYLIISGEASTLFEHFLEGK